MVIFSSGLSYVKHVWLNVLKASSVLGVMTLGLAVTWFLSAGQSFSNFATMAYEVVPSEGRALNLGKPCRFPCGTSLFCVVWVCGDTHSTSLSSPLVVSFIFFGSEIEPVAILEWYPFSTYLSGSRKGFKKCPMAYRKSCFSPLNTCLITGSLI